MIDVYKENLLKELEKLHKRNEFSKEITPDYYEPGMMEYLDQSEGTFDPATGEVLVRFESKGVRYNGRAEQIEKVNLGDPITVARDKENQYNYNNFVLLTAKRQDVGYMPAELCNAVAPLYDDRRLVFDEAHVSYVEPISKRSRHAKQAMLFVELKAHFAG